MDLLIINLFTTFALWSINPGLRVRLLRAFMEGKPQHTYLTTPIKPLDCFPCFTWWVSLAVGAFAWGFTGELQILPAMAAYVVAQFYEKYE